MRDPIAKLDDHFSVVVAWRRLAADHYDPRHELFRTFADRCIFDRYVAMHDVKNVKQLTLVLVNTFNLNIV